ncbi:MAG: site-2 protease family protein [Candidatus Bathyarchaeota archaeon]|nr:site-2 protease family protein [Candidatus Bathyarchaeota archaeon]
MCCASSDDYFADPVGVPPFEQVQVMVESEFDVEESFVDHDIPTFHIRYREDSKEAFLRLTQRLESLELLPILRQKEEKVVLQVLQKPPTKPSQNIVNIALFFATLGTVFISGYYQSADILGALLFTGAIMAILGSHEMGHKLLADKHDVEATYPYFIPGLPPIGTFGALIRQKALPPNKDALFDIGFTGPITGFIIAIIIMIIGMHLPFQVVQDPTVPGTPLNELYPLMYRVIILMFPPIAPEGVTVIPHPVVFAAWVGMVVTMLNLVPSGMFDGGHIARSLMGSKAHQIISYLGIALLVVIWWPMAILALFFSAAKHPGPLDDVSKLTNSRKLGAIGLVAVFILSVVPMGLAF